YAHNKLGTLSIAHRFTFDSADRLNDSYITVGSASEIWTTSLDYNELGQVKHRNLDNELSDNGNGIGTMRISAQQLDYQYNIRGWLSDINDVSSISKLGTDYFAMKLHYDDGNSSLNADNQYTGNISWAEWRTSRDSVKRQYGYSYDPLDRITKAKYGAYNKDD